MATGYEKRGRRHQEPVAPAPRWKPTPEDKARVMLTQGVTPDRIMKRTGLPRSRVSALMLAYLKERRDDPAESDEVAKQRQVVVLENIEMAYRDEADRTGSSRPLRHAMTALAEQRKIRGLDAPSKSLTVNVEATAQADRNLDLNQALFHEYPEALEHVLAIKAIQRARGTARGDGRGGLGDPHEPGRGALGQLAAPGRDQSQADACDLRAVPEADDLRPS